MFFVHLFIYSLCQLHWRDLNSTTNKHNKSPKLALALSSFVLWESIAGAALTAKNTNKKMLQEGSRMDHLMARTQIQTWHYSYAHKLLSRSPLRKLSLQSYNTRKIYSLTTSRNNNSEI